MARPRDRTVEWYSRVLGMDYTTAFAEDHVPSTGEYDPYMHVFLDAGNGNVLAFFELPNQNAMGRDENTPAWVQHLAFKVGSEEELQVPWYTCNCPNGSARGGRPSCYHTAAVAALDLGIDLSGVTKPEKKRPARG